MEELVLVPNVRTLRRDSGVWAHHGQALRDAGVSIQVELKDNPQAYRLTITPDGAQIESGGPAGAVSGAQTLAQLARQFPEAIPALAIADAPDFPVRGVMLDISRDKVPTMPTLLAIVDDLAAMKINHLQLYTEHTFAYRKHAVVWEKATPMTAEEIRALDQYCRERFIELTPNQNSFGHMERWLKHDKYKHLAECSAGFTTPWGQHREQGSTLCPGDTGSLVLIDGLYEELLPSFTSKLFNVGCDETFELGQGRSKVECEKRGIERVYLEFLLKIHQLVQRHGKTMQFWGDIILHKPELIRELPGNIIALEWGYDAGHPFDRDGGLFAEAAVPFWVCPGTSSWLSLAGRTDNALANLRSAAEHGLKHGAGGYLNTDWGDHGHLQYWPTSFLPIAAGAAYSWCMQANRDLPLTRALDLHVFRDTAGVLGQLAHELGNVYQKIGRLQGNSSAIFWLLLGDRDDAKLVEGITLETLAATEAAIGDAVSRLSEARCTRPDADLIYDEFRNTAAMLRAAVHVGRARLSGQGMAALLQRELTAIIAEHRRLWLARNRLGGLADSAGRLEKVLQTWGA